MDLDMIHFPTLLIADDGWVQEFANKDELSTLTRAALRKYAERRVVLFDSSDQAWQVERIEPQQPESALNKLISTISNGKVAVRTTVKAIEKSLQAAKEALTTAVDADDDILTQFTNAPELKTAINKAESYETLVNALKAARAI